MTAARRDTSIDFARAVALVLIILAHVKSPAWLEVFRCFDVPLIVFVSGLSHAGKSVDWSPKFFISRAKRLLVPTWLFILVVLVPFMYLVAGIGMEHYVEVGWKANIDTLLLLNNGSYGYVWIIRVFLLIMLATPLMMAVARALKRWWAFIALIVMLLVANQMTMKALPATGGFVQFFINEYVVYLLGYSVFFLLGLRLRRVAARVAVNVFATAVLILGFVLIYIKTGILCVNHWKYPPTLYFLLYGIGMSLLLWNNISVFGAVARWPALQFVGRNTLWLYLWHIPFVYVCNSYVPCWALRYILVAAGALAVYCLQYRLACRSRHAFARKYLVG